MEVQETNSTATTSWQQKIPWILTISSFVVLMIIGYFLVDNVNWFKNIVFEGVDKNNTNTEYQIYVYHMHLSMIKRSVGLFSGFAVMFLGIGVSFYTIKELTKIEVNSPSISGSLITASPGIIAMIIGAALIILTINSKDVFPGYSDNQPAYKISDEPIPK